MSEESVVLSEETERKIKAYAHEYAETSGAYVSMVGDLHALVRAAVGEAWGQWQEHTGTKLSENLREKTARIAELEACSTALERERDEARADRDSVRRERDALTRATRRMKAETDELRVEVQAKRDEVERLTLERSRWDDPMERLVQCECDLQNVQASRDSLKAEVARLRNELTNYSAKHFANDVLEADLDAARKAIERAYSAFGIEATTTSTGEREARRVLLDWLTAHGPKGVENG